MSLDRRVAYGALLTPAGVHVVAYRRARGGPLVERYTREVRAGLGAEEAAGTLASLLEAEGARGRRVSIAVTGFGTCHQILTLPRAARELLQPIVVRELRRFYPDLFAAEEEEPVVDFVELQSDDAAAAPQRELLVAAIPRGFLHTVASALSARGIRLEHWTIVPRALQRLYDAWAGEEETAAALVMVPGWPLLGFFHDRELRLFSEPRLGPGLAGEAGSEAVAEHVERGAIFLRQQFRGATVGRLFLAGSDTDPGLARQLADRLSLPVAHLGPAAEAPGAFAALGAALDAASPEGLNLLPAELRPPSEADRWTRRMAVASAAILLAAAGWWGWQASRAEARAREELAVVAEQIEARSSGVAPILPVIRERQAHAQRAALLALLSHDRRRLPEVLWPLQAAAPRVSVRSLQVERQPEGWQVSIAVTATAYSAAEATDAIEALAQQLGAELPEGAVALGGMALDRVPPETDSAGVALGPTPIAASVDMSFLVPTLAGAGE